MLNLHPKGNSIVSKKLIVASLAASVAAMSSPTFGHGAMDKLDKLNSLAIIGYLECDQKGNVVRRLYEASGKRVEFSPMTDCIREQRANINEAIFNTIPFILEKPKALKALMAFRSMWNSKITHVGEVVDEKAVDDIQDAIRTVRTKLGQ
jgi:hypothetical protein